MKTGQSKRIMRTITIIVTLSIAFCFLPPLNANSLNPTRVIRVGYFDFYGFNDINENGALSGYGYEYLMEISKYTGWKYEFITESEDGTRLTYEEAVKMLEEGTVDIVGSIRKNEEREEKMLFPTCYAGYSMGVLTTTRLNNKYKINMPETYKGMKIGLLEGNSRNDEIRDYIETYNIEKVTFKEYKQEEELSTALKIGEIDAIYTSNLRKTTDERFLVKMARSDFYFAFSKSNQEAFQELETALMQIDTAEPFFKDELMQKYYSNTSINEFTLTEEQKAYIEQLGVIRVGISKDMAPMEYYDSKKAEYVGTVVDIYNYLADITGIQFEYCNFQKQSAIEQMGNSDDVMILAAFPQDYNFAQEHNLMLTSSYMSANVNAVANTQKSEPDIVALCEETYITKLIKERNPDMNFIYCDSIEECVDYVNKGVADITYIPSDCADIYVNTPRYTKIISYNVPELSYMLCSAISSNCDRELLLILNAAISAIPELTINHYVIQNTVKYHPKTTLEDFIYANALLLMAMFLIIIFAMIATSAVYIYMRKKAENVHGYDTKKIEVALTKTKISLWDFDTTNRTLRCNEGERGEIFLENIPESQISNGKIYPAHAELYRNFCKRLVEGDSSVSEEILMKDYFNDKGGDNSYHWYRITCGEFTTIKHCQHILGVKEIIDDKKKAEAAFSVEQSYRKNILGESIYFFMLNITSGVVEESRYRKKDEIINLNLRNCAEIVQILSDEMFEREDVKKLTEMVNIEALCDSFYNKERTKKMEYRYVMGVEKIVWCELCIRMFTNPYTEDMIAFIYTRDINGDKIEAIRNQNKLHIMQMAVENSFTYLFLLDLEKENFECMHYPEGANVLHFGAIEELARELESRCTNQEKGIMWYLKVPERIKMELMTSDRIEIQERMDVVGNHNYEWYEIILEYEMDLITKQMLCTAMVRNIQKIKANEEKLYITAKKAEKSANVKQEFLANMSHEIRTPLNGVIGMLELLSEEKKPQEDYLKKALLSAEHLRNLVDDILDMSKIENGKIKLKNDYVSNDEFHSYVLAVASSLAKQSDIVFKSDVKANGTVGFYGDGGRLKQIIVNILSNAIKYTNAGGNVMYSCSAEYQKNGSEQLIYTICDNGIGMSEEFLMKAFEPFEQMETESKLKGTGLGLAITKNLVELMGGSINIESKIGEGTNVTIVIPTIFVKEGEVIKAHEGNDRPLCNLDEVLKGKRAMIVEDHEINMEIADRLFTKMGFAVTRAVNGQEAVDIFEKSKDNYFDIIFMDIMMPIKDGYTATREIRAMKRPDAKTIPIIAMTANAFAEDIIKSKENGLNYHMTKPIDKKQIISILQQIF